MTVINKIYSILSDSERSGFYKVLMLYVGLSLSEILGLASVMPILAVVGNPDVIEKNTSIYFLYLSSIELGVVKNHNEFIIFLGIMSFILIAFAAIFRGYTQYYNNAYIENVRHQISKRILSIYVHQPYSFFIGRHTSELSKNILSDVDQSIERVIRPILFLLSNLVILVALIALLIIINPLLILITVCLMFFLYTMIFLLFQKHIKKYGDNLVEANRVRFLSATEVLSGIKTVKMLNSSRFGINTFGNASQNYSKSHAGHQTLGILPSYIVEVTVFGAIMALILIFTVMQNNSVNGSNGEMLSILGFYALALIRLKPVAQTIYQGVSALKFGNALISNLYNEFQLSGNVPKKFNNKNIKFENSIEIRDLSYSYPDKSIKSLNKISIIINKNSSLGVIGHTGSGKSTFIDILLGMLTTDIGSIMIDGVKLKNVHETEWQKKIGYVPQEIFLVDLSIAENIAFGLSKEKIDYNKIIRASKIACVHEFVSDLPDGYETKVGERGIGLSGGQRQRIGIARAFYRDPEILIFDEATSALDKVTEELVMDSIHSFSRKKTMIFITHQTSTLTNCDNIICLKGGKLINSGTYKKLLNDGFIKNTKIIE